MGRRRGEVETDDRSLGAAGAGNRPKHQLLVELGGSAVDGSPVEVPVGALQARGGEHVATSDEGSKAGGQRLHPGLHPLDEPLHPARVIPIDWELIGGVPSEVPGYTGIGPSRLRPGWRSGGVGSGLLAEEQKGPGRELSHGDVGGELGEVVEVVCDVDRASLSSAVSIPRNRRVERPVDLDSGYVPLETGHILDHAGREMLMTDQIGIEHRRCDVGDDCPPGVERLT